MIGSLQPFDPRRRLGRGCWPEYPLRNDGPRKGRKDVVAPQISAGAILEVSRVVGRVACVLQIDPSLLLGRRFGSFAGGAARFGKPGMIQQVCTGGANAVAIRWVCIEVAAKNEAVALPQPSAAALVIDDVVRRCSAL